MNSLFQIAIPVEGGLGGGEKRTTKATSPSLLRLLNTAKRGGLRAVCRALTCLPERHAFGESRKQHPQTSQCSGPALVRQHELLPARGFVDGPLLSCALRLRAAITPLTTHMVLLPAHPTSTPLCLRTLHTPPPPPTVHWLARLGRAFCLRPPPPPLPSSLLAPSKEQAATCSALKSAPTAITSPCSQPPPLTLRHDQLVLLGCCGCCVLALL